MIVAAVAGLSGALIGRPAVAEASPEASPGPDLLATGTITASTARWSSAGIVTESVLVAADGSELRLHQLGGTVDGIGMRVFPAPSLLRPGDRVEVQLSRRRDATWTVREVRATLAGGPVAPLSAPPGDEVPLGFVRTVNSTGAALHWASGCVVITYDEAGTSHLPGGQEFVLMDEALQTWRSSTQSCSYITFSMAERSDQEVGYDRVNLMKFRDSRWCRPATAEDAEECYAPSAAALTTLYFVDDEESDRNGELLDADIELNGVNFSISYQGSSLGTPACLSDLLNTFTHEVGHLLGLDHTCWTGTGEHPVDGDGNPVPSCGQTLPPAITEATMFTYQECGEEKKATLEADDIAGLCQIYPTADDPGECSAVTPNGRDCCAVTPGRRRGEHGPGSTLLLLVLAAVVAGIRRTSRFVARP